MAKRNATARQMRLLLRTKGICVPEERRANLLIALAELLANAATSPTVQAGTTVPGEGGSDDNVEADR